jgi:hypothetical protein
VRGSILPIYVLFILFTTLVEDIPPLPYPGRVGRGSSTMPKYGFHLVILFEPSQSALPVNMLAFDFDRACHPDVWDREFFSPGTYVKEVRRVGTRNVM